jgi:SAM-dependent methyltransferase
MISAQSDGLCVLDLCCGRGGGLNYLHFNYNLGPSLGIDFSAQAISYANRAFTKSDRLEWRLGDVENFDIQNSYDVVLMIESVHCISNLESLFEKVQKIMHPGSYFVIADSIDDEVTFEETALKHF